MKALYKCAKITQSLQRNIKPLFALCLFKSLNAFNLSASSNKISDNKLHLLR